MTTFTVTGRLLAFLGLLSLLGIACFLWDWAALLWSGLLLALAGLVAADWWLLRRAEMRLRGQGFNHQPTVQRPFKLQLDLEPQLGKHLRFSLEAVESDLFKTEEKQARITPLSAGAGHQGATVHTENDPAKPAAGNADGNDNNRADHRAESHHSPTFLRAEWELIPKERGQMEWPGAIVGYRSPLGLLNKWQTLPPVPVKVYPKLHSSLQSLLNPDLLLEQMGVKNNRFRRADQVFESLRPYLKGDNYRHIDWKASARSNSLVTRQFQMEQHHNILVCLDASRLMGTLTDGITKLDWSIEAALHLAYLADHLKDRIGLVVFSGQVDRWVTPRRHPVEAFLNATFDIKSRIVEADLNAVCANILAHQKKRSLVIFLSDFIDAASLQPFMPSFAQLNRKHCSLFIGIEDPAYRRYLGPDFVIGDAMDATRRIVAQDSMNRREAVLQQLRQMGLRALSTTPENLVRRAMAAYLEIKTAGAI